MLCPIAQYCCCACTASFSVLEICVSSSSSRACQPRECTVLQVKAAMVLAELNLPAHDWLAQPQWGRLRDALHLLSLRAAALECLLEGVPYHTMNTGCLGSCPA